MRICRGIENWRDLRALSGKFLRQKSCYPESFHFLWLCVHALEGIVLALQFLFFTKCQVWNTLVYILQILLQRKTQFILNDFYQYWNFTAKAWGSLSLLCKNRKKTWSIQSVQYICKTMFVIWSRGLSTFILTTLSPLCLAQFPSYPCPR